MSKKHHGFSLMEILITLSIIAILTSIVYPNYASALQRSHQLEAKNALLDLQRRYERYFVTHNSYENATIGHGEKSILSETFTRNKHYTLEISEQSATHYLLTAIPTSSAAKQDTRCASFTLNSYGEQNISGDDSVYNCWHR